jgi:hypothetical protein
MDLDYSICHICSNPVDSFPDHYLLWTAHLMLVGVDVCNLLVDHSYTILEDMFVEALHIIISWNADNSYIPTIDNFGRVL